MRTKSTSFSLALCLLAACSSGTKPTDVASRSGSITPLSSGGPIGPVVTPVDVALTPSPEPSAPGQPVTIVVNVTSTYSVDLTGDITLTYNGNNVGEANAVPTAPLAGSSSATFTVTLPAGTDTVVATYTPGATDGPSVAGNAGSTDLHIGYATTTNLSASSYSPQPNTTVMLYASVGSGAPSTTAAPTGTVSFADPTFGTLCQATPVGGIASCTVAVSGSYSITATFAGDTNYFASTSNTISIDANPGDIDGQTTVVVSSSSVNRQSTYGDAVTFTANVFSPQTVSPLGQVSFFVNGTALPCAPQLVDASGNATCVLKSPPPPLSAGFDRIVAVYTDNGNGLPDGSGSLIQTVAQVAPTLDLAIGAAPQVGQTSAYTATLGNFAPHDATGPTGTIELFVSSDGTSYSSVGTMSVSSGVATFSIAYTSIQTLKYKAVYSGDTNYTEASSSVLTETVGQASAPTVSLSTSASTATPGTTVTFTATVKNYATGIVPTGTVSFYGTPTGGMRTLLGTGTLGADSNAADVATFGTTFTVGTYSIVAIYQGDTSYPASAASNAVSETIALNAISVAVAADPTSSHAGDSVVFTATITPAPAGGTVDFSDDQGNSLCTGKTLTSGVATCTSSTLAAGTRTVTASYSGDTADAQATGSVTIVVTGYATTTTLTSSPTTSAYGTAVVFTASVSSTHSGTPTGTVTFSDGTTSSGALTLSGGHVTYTVSTLAIGAHDFTAVYSGDNTFLTSTGTATQTVTKNTTTTVITTSSNPAAPSSSVKLTATVVSTSTIGGPGGTVSFFDGTTNIGSGTLTSGVATYTTTSLAAGTHSLSAQYVGDTHFVTSTSPAISQVITASAATLSVTASPSPAGPGQSITFSATVGGTLGTATGTITLTEGVTSIGIITLSNGAGTLAASSFGIGTHTFTATYSGDHAYGSTVGSVVLVVTQATTTCALVSSANPSTVGESVTFTVTVASSLSGVAGTVQLYDGQTTIGTATLTSGTATIVVDSLTAGSHTIQAQYVGNETYAESASTVLIQVVNAGADFDADGGTPPNGDLATTTTTTKSSGGCEVANGSASGALAALFLLAVVVLLRKRSTV